MVFTSESSTGDGGGGDGRDVGDAGDAGAGIDAGNAGDAGGGRDVGDAGGGIDACGRTDAVAVSVSSSFCIYDATLHPRITRPRLRRKSSITSTPFCL